jgi:hypothetical protein
MKRYLRDIIRSRARNGAHARNEQRHKNQSRIGSRRTPSARAQRHRRVARGCLVCGERSIVGIEQ